MRRDMRDRDASGRVGSPRRDRDRRTGYTDTIVAIAPPRDTPVYRYGLTPVPSRTFPFHFLSARDASERASERATDFSRPRSPRPVSFSHLSLSFSHSSLFRDSFNRRRTPPSCGLTRSYDFSGRAFSVIYSPTLRNARSTIRRRFRVRARALREKGEEDPNAPSSSRRDEMRSGSGKRDRMRELKE